MCKFQLCSLYSRFWKWIWKSVRIIIRIICICQSSIHQHQLRINVSNSIGEYNDRFKYEWRHLRILELSKTVVKHEICSIKSSIHWRNVRINTRGIWKVMHIDPYNFTEWSEKQDEGISVNVRIWGFWGYHNLMLQRCDYVTNDVIILYTAWHWKTAFLVILWLLNRYSFCAFLISEFNQNS